MIIGSAIGQEQFVCQGSQIGQEQFLCRDYQQQPYGSQRAQMGYQEMIPGGHASGMLPSDFDRAQLAIGTRVEMEHTRDVRLAREIAMDHLSEDPDYYQKLSSIHLDGAIGEVDWFPVMVAASIGVPALVAGGAAGYTGHRIYGTIKGAAIAASAGGLLGGVLGFLYLRYRIGKGLGALV